MKSLLITLLPLLTSALPTAPTNSTNNANAQGMISKTACPPYAVLFARGTTEVAPYGETVGPPFIASLQKIMPAGTIYYGVQYPADIPGFLAGGSPIGISDMMQRAEGIVGGCPGTKLVMSGYSYVLLYFLSWLLVDTDLN
jgi:cutinase